MRWLTWWQILIALQARSFAQSVSPTVCEDEACRCDAFTRVICNCTGSDDEVIFRPDGAYRVPPTTSGIIVNGCAKVQFLPETIRNLFMLRNVELRNVGRVVISDRALAWTPFNSGREGSPGIRIAIHNSTVNEIASHSIQGRVDTILITNSTLNAVRPYAFSSLTGVNNIELSDNEFGNLEIQAFKKFTTSNFILRGGSIRTLPSRFLSDVEVTNLFRMEGVTVNHISSLSFLVSSPQRVLIEGNLIGVLQGDGFSIVTRGPITFRNNTVRTVNKGAFLGFTAHPDVTSVMGPLELLVDNNTMTDLAPSSLMYNRESLTLRIDGLNLNTSCACELTDEWKVILREQGGAINCWYALQGHYISLPTFMDTRCGKFKQTFWIFIVVGIIIVFIVAVIVILYILKREHEKKKKVQIVMPDGKTYRETEFHIVVERAELLTTDL